MTINFFLQSKQDTSSIYVRLRDGLIDAKAKTDLIIKASEWSVSKQQPKNMKDAVYKRLNASLTSLKDKLTHYYNDSKGKQRIDSDWLKEFINPSKTESNVPQKLAGYFDFYLEHKASSTTPETHKKTRTVKRMVVNFQAYEKREYYINEVDFKSNT